MREALEGYRGSRVFVTGHTGFKGSWLAFLLGDVGAEVMGYALDPSTTPSHFELLRLGEKISHVVGDIRDGAKLASAMHAFQPEYVFHLAAQALVKKSYREPRATFETNVMGSINVLEAVRQCDSVRSLVYVTSDKCYENVEWVWGYRENDRLGGHDPYSASKAAAEIVFAAYERSFFSDRANFGSGSVRAGNVIGGGDWAEDRIVPDCVRAAQENGAITLRNPGSTRPWQHVLEPISGYLLLGSRLRSDGPGFSGSWNFGPPSSEVRNVRSVAETIMRRLASGRVEVASDKPAHHEARLLQLNCDKAHQLLDWYPRWNVETALEMTGSWYKHVHEGADPPSVTREQIRAYFTELG